MFDLLFKIHFFEILSAVSFIAIATIVYFIYFEEKSRKTKLKSDFLDKNIRYFPYLLLVVLVINLLISLFLKKIDLTWLQLILYIVAIMSGGFAAFNDNLKKHGRK